MDRFHSLNFLGYILDCITLTSSGKFQEDQNEPFWLNTEVFRAARVLTKEVSAFYHQEELTVMDWGHAFVYHPAEINFTRALHERFPKIPSAGR